MATTASRTTSTIAATVALTAAVAVWQYQQRSSKYTSTSGKDDSVDTTARDIDSSINDRLEAPQEVMIQSSPVKPSNNPTMEEDSVSVTDRSSSSESDPEATASDLDKTIDEDDNEHQAETPAEASNEDPREAMKLVLDEITRWARPDAEEVKAVGFDSDEVPKYVRVVKDLNAVQYTGVVGAGTRCVRAIDALPRPASFKTVVTKSVPAKSSKKTVLRKRNKKAATTTTTKLVPEPFVEAFQLADGSECNTPRLASYFEVDIVEGPEEGIDKASASGKQPCIAVGVSLHQFDWERSMPGWNVLSFGYHSDDGASFFAKHKQAYGPVFGVGDTVGCGIDYTQRRVFYTLNGKFLGYSFELNSTQLSRGKWIPTVGMDSHAAVVYNKAGPFKFDLTTIMNKEDDARSESEETTATERVQL